jgi:hypothetical protein
MLRKEMALGILSGTDAEMKAYLDWERKVWTEMFERIPGVTHREVSAMLIENAFRQLPIGTWTVRNMVTAKDVIAYRALEAELIALMRRFAAIEMRLHG